MKHGSYVRVRRRSWKSFNPCVLPLEHISALAWQCVLFLEVQHSLAEKHPLVLKRTTRLSRWPHRLLAARMALHVRQAVKVRLICFTSLFPLRLLLRSESPSSGEHRCDGRGSGCCGGQP